MPTDHFKNLLEQAKADVQKSLKHLLYSYRKTSAMALSPDLLEDDEVLESFEGLVARFSRTSDIFIAKYIKTYVMIQEPGFRGSLLDLLNQAEKFELIEDTQKWTEIREIRNSAVHEYSSEDLINYFKKVLTLTPTILNIAKTVQ
jgi:hypothetical protein